MFLSKICVYHFLDDDFIKEERKTCKHVVRQIYGTLSYALSTCLLDPMCDKVLDARCDAKQPFLFCTRGPNEEPFGIDISPCVYMKPKSF